MPSKKALSRIRPLEKGDSKRPWALSMILRECSRKFGILRCLSSKAAYGPLYGVFLKEPRAIEKKISGTSALGKGSTRRPWALSLILKRISQNFGILRIASSVFGGFRQWNWLGKAV